MLISLVVWIYISLICLIWGHISLSVINGSAGTEISPVDTSLVCIAGLSVIGTLALCLSLFMPLDWKAHGILLIPALAYLGKAAGRRAIKIQLTSMVAGFSRTGYCLLAVCILMVLAISVHTIAHPDTLNYHAKSILLFERYTTIPGIANLKKEMGFQCSWFASLALFKLDSAAFDNIIFLNGAVLCWYFIFVVRKIASAGSGNNRWAWLLLLSYTFFSWTQIRLTAASASPDFIVSLYIWTAIYVFLQKDRPLYLPLIVLCCCAALLTKLSAIIILPLAIIAIAGSFRLRPAKPLILFSSLALIILFIRNRIASGYLLYPFSRPDIFNPPWKMKGSTITNFQHYISVYARFPIDDIKDVGTYWQFTYSQWLPRWWAQLNFPDRLLLLGILAGILLHLVLTLVYIAKGKQAPASPEKKYTLVLLIALGGSLLWFLGAPSPRFGTGFLVSLLFLLYRGLPLSIIPARLASFIKNPRTGKFPCFLLATGIFIIIVAGYTVYRCIYFLPPSEWIYPSGIMKSAYQPIGCENIQVDLEKDRIDIRPKTGGVYCKDSIGGFSPIGRAISEGFRPAE